MAKNMRVITHEINNEVPPGMALLCMDDNGWVGTNNGWPYVGQPALFPEAQAKAIAYAWSFLMDRGGAKVFPRSTSREEVGKFNGLALFDLFPEHPDVLDWMDPTKRVGHPPRILEA